MEKGGGGRFTVVADGEERSARLMASFIDMDEWGRAVLNPV